MHLIAAALASLLSLGVEPESVCLPDRLEAQRAYEQRVLGSVSPERLRALHEELAAEPHPAGTAGDERVIGLIADHFRALDLEVEVHEFETYLAEPVSASVELVSPVRRSLAIKEKAVEGDPYSSREGLSFGWNAYSGSGDVTGEVVYVNRGTLEDFNTLRELGVSLRGKIAIARYGGNFRGFKAKYAEEAGAIGLLIYTDPGDSGYARGPMWPEGGWANETSIQRGSIKALEYPGDPLTPGWEASPGAKRLDPREVDLPRIPVQPIGWGAAQEILSRFDGKAVPKESWQGALPFPYRLSGGDVRVRLSVSQSRGMVRSANVIGTLRGTKPGAAIYLGSHHDAWGFGAHDPLSGTIGVLEAATVFATLAKEGQRPERSIVFCAWGAEEHGIIGSTEWVEGNESLLLREGVAYFNLDASASGLRLGASASPSLKALIADVTKQIESPSKPNLSVFEEWSSRSRNGAGDGPSLGNLGGGSDHIAFYTRMGVPSAGIGAGGASGTSYHTIYDNLAWYQQTVGDDYAPAALVTRATALSIARLAGASLLPFDLSAYGRDALRHCESLERRAEELGVRVDLAPLTDAATGFERAATATQERMYASVASGALDGAALRSVNSLLLSFERLWLTPEGLTGRPWFRNLFASSDPTSGYAAWMLPEVRRAIERGKASEARAAVERTAGALRLMTDALKSLHAMTPEPASSE